MNDNSETKQKKRALKGESLLSAMALVMLTAGYTQPAQAGATFKIDDTKWVSIGGGLRTSFEAAERKVNVNGQSHWNNDFNLDNIRLYLNAQIHEYIKVEFNTDCQTCGNGGEMRILDAIGKFEFNPYVNLWIGRMLVPAERREMNGPFYSATYNIFSSGTPFEPADFNLTIKNDGTSAGSFGRDDGATFWGAAFDNRLQYAFGFFRGLRGGANAEDNILYAQRIAYNFWDVEKNPGYYTSGTYYGKGGDIFTVGVSNQYQRHGVGTGANALGLGTLADAGDFRGTTVDVLLEKVLPNNGVLTFNGEYKNYGISGGYSQATRNAATAAGVGFNMFEGNAYDVSAMYLFPQKVAIGQFQPYLRYVNVSPTHSSGRNSYQAGLNYVIDSHNAKISLMYDYGDMSSKGLNYSSTAAGLKGSGIKLGFQWQF